MEKKQILQRKTKRSSTKDKEEQQNISKQKKIEEMKNKIFEKVAKIKETENYKQSLKNQEAEDKAIQVNIDENQAYIFGDNDQTGIEEQLQLLIKKLTEQLSSESSLRKEITEDDFYKIYNSWEKVCSNIISKEASELEKFKKNPRANADKLNKQNEDLELLCTDLDHIHDVIDRIIKFAEDNPEEQYEPNDIEELVSCIKSNLFNDDYPANKLEGVRMLYNYITDDIPFGKFLFFQEVMKKITDKEYDDKNIDQYFDHEDVSTAYFEILGIEVNSKATKKFNKAIDEVKKFFSKQLKNLVDTYNNKTKHHPTFE